MTDPTPDDVRAAILKAADSLATIRGFLPSNVGFPIMMADGKLRVAMTAVDSWEAMLRLEAMQAKSSDTSR